MEDRGNMPPGRRTHRQYPTSVSPEQTTPFVVVATYPHDSAAFTQGLEYHHGYLWEGTGLHRRSCVRQVALTTGQVVKSVPNQDASVFGEGITIVNDTLIQLTWQSSKAYTYSYPGLALLTSFPMHTHTGEGWGACFDGRRIIVSDGSEYLTFWDPKTFEIIGNVQVKDDAGRPVVRLNELECVEGEVLANIWLTNNVARINPASGKLIELLDFSFLKPAIAGDVLNGIAYDPVSSSPSLGYRLYMTGKLWGSLFEINWRPSSPLAPKL